MPRLTRAITWTPMGGFGVTSFSTTIITTPPEKRSIFYGRKVSIAPGQFLRLEDSTLRRTEVVHGDKRANKPSGLEKTEPLRS